MNLSLSPPSEDHLLPSSSPSPSLPMTSSEKKSIIILLFLYFIQGIPIGLFDSSIPLILIENGVGYKDLGLLSFVGYPYSLKLLFAPVEDAYFSKRVGRRKSYVLPCQYLIALLFLFSGSFIENLVKNQYLGSITLLGIVFIALASWQDIAVDGWVLKMFSETHVKWGPVCNSIGQLLGVVFGGSLFIQLSSIRFCNQYLYSEPKTVPILTLSGFFYLCSGLIFLITLFVHFFVEEKQIQAEVCQKLHIFEVVKSLKGFFQNKNLRFLVFVLFFWRLGFAGVGSTSTLRLIQQGFAKETFTTIFALTMPMSLLASCFIGRFLKRHCEMKVWIILFVLKFVENIANYFLINNYSNINKELFLFLLIGLNFYSVIVTSSLLVLAGAFFSRVSDEDIGGTYITFLNSTLNMGNLWSASFILYIIENNNYNIVIGLSWIYIVLFYGLLGGKIRSLDDIPKREWTLRKEGSTLELNNIN